MNILGKQQIERIERLFDKVIKSGISVKQAKGFSAKQWKNAGFSKKVLKKESLEGQKRWLNQIEKHHRKVIEKHWKQHGIKDEDSKKFIRKQYKKLWKVEKKDKEKKREFPNVKIQGSIHDRQFEINIKSYADLQRLYDELEGSSRNYSRNHNAIVVRGERDRIKRILKVYSDFDHGAKISFFGRV